jgi:hypothetical protein
MFIRHEEYTARRFTYLKVSIGTHPEDLLVFACASPAEGPPPLSPPALYWLLQVLMPLREQE